MAVITQNGLIGKISKTTKKTSEIKLITTNDRPLSSSREALTKRYKERYSIYIDSADVVIDGSGTVDEVAKRIEADFYEYSCN